MNPLVTVNILSFNRRDELRNTLTKVYEQDYKNIEVIVVDNASEDGSPKMVEEEFPDVILIKLDKNIGIAGWNKGFEIAKGEYVLVLDDDSYPSKDLLWNFASMNCKRDTIYALRVFNSSMNVIELDIHKYQKNPNFNGCGAIIGDEVIKKIKGFNCKLFIYYHEIDFTLKALQEGFNLSFFPNGSIFHRSKNFKNISGITKYYLMRNSLYTLLSHFSLSKVFFRMIRMSMGRTISTLKQGGLFFVVKAILAVIFTAPIILINKKPISKELQKKYKYGSFLGGFHFSERNWSF